jgi:hypothetical protein
MTITCVINFTCFWASDASSARFADDIAYARDMGQKFGFGLNVLPGNAKARGFVLPFKGKVNKRDDVVAIHHQAEGARSISESRLWIFYVSDIDPAVRTQAEALEGMTVRKGLLPIDVPVFCLIKTDIRTTNRSAVLHEACHASGSNHNEVPDVHNIMHSPPSILPDNLIPSQFMRLETSFFSTSV